MQTTAETATLFEQEDITRQMTARTSTTNFTLQPLHLLNRGSPSRFESEEGEDAQDGDNDSNPNRLFYCRDETCTASFLSKKQLDIHILRGD